ncbi:MAG: transposase [Nitrospirae bacterium]|nr:transposase [Nitrospirota bacterium]
MGEAKRRSRAIQTEVSKAIGVQTAVGKVQVRWDNKAEATPFGQMVFFIEFLTMTGLWNSWVEECPLEYRSPNGSSKRDILGTWLLSILSGHRRYAHVTTIRTDGVNPGLLGMKDVVSEDTLRRALQAIEEEPGFQWLQRHIDKSVLALIGAPWILDVDVTIKPLYGKQEGAEVGFNPKKPGRPSHAYHSYQMAGLRLVLGVDVEAGNHSHGNYTMPGLMKILDKLPEDKQPYLVRGDAGLGSEDMLSALERRAQSYLFKLRITANVKRYIERVFWNEGWENAGQGWEGREGELRLSGWSRSRRVIVMRRPLKGEIALADDQQMIIGFAETERPIKKYEYAVLVTDLEHEVVTIAQLYRDRADSENSFDELKNQWGWGGFTTQDLKRCRFTAMAVALVYNWWSLFVRLANPKARLEAITSRPFLLSGVARRTTHSGQQHLSITTLHGNAQEAQGMLSRVSSMLNQWKIAAEQLNLKSVWQYACEHIITTVTGFRLKSSLLLTAQSSG